MITKCSELSAKEVAIAMDETLLQLATLTHESLSQFKGTQEEQELLQIYIKGKISAFVEVHENIMELLQVIENEMKEKRTNHKNFMPSLPISLN